MSTAPHDHALYQGLFRTMTEGCAVHELVHDEAGAVIDYRILDVNDAYVEIVGLEPEAVLGRLATEVYGTHAAPYLERYARVAMTGEPDQFEVHFRPMAKHFRISVFSPRLHAFVTVFADITREKEEAAALEAEVAHKSDLLEQALDSRVLVDSVASAVFTVDAQRRVTSWNREAELLTGYGVDEAIGQPCTMFAKEPCTQGCSLLDDSGGEAVRGRECRVLRKDGRVITILKNAVPLHDDTGAAVGTVESFVDISEERAAREKLVASEHRLRALFENLDAGCAIYRAVDGGTDFVFRDLNATGERLEGVDRMDLVGRRVTECFPGIREMGLLEVFERVQRTGEPENLPAAIYEDERLMGWRENYVFRLPDGDLVAVYRDRTEEKQVEHELARYKDKLEELVGARTLQLRDEVAEHVRTRRALQQSEARLRAIFGALPDLVFLVDEDGRYREVLTGEEDLLVRPSDEVRGARLQDFFEPALVERFMALVQKTIEAGTTQRIEYTLELPDGLHHFEGRSAPLEQPVQGRRAMVFVARDISDRKKLEWQLSDALDLSEAITRAAPVGISAYDADGRCVMANEAACRIVGADHEQVLAQNFRHIESWKRSGLLDAAARALAGQSSERVEIHTTSSFGREVWLDIRLAPVSSRQRHHLLAVYDDISEQRVAEREVRELTRDLEDRVRRRTVALQAANKELEAFAYSVSHDLRAPLRAIDGFSRAVLEDYGERLDDDGREYLERLCGASQRMGGLIDDLLKLSRLTRRSFEPSTVDLTGMAAGILEELQAAEPDRETELHVDPELVVRGDRALLGVALRNLLENAWKFTGQRPITRIRITGRTLPDALAVSVSDNGAGFDMTYVDKLFGPFQRLHGMTEFPGNGIGLATVQRAVLRHGGRVHAEGRVGEGATFTFILPSHGRGSDSVPPRGV